MEVATPPEQMTMPVVGVEQAAPPAEDPREKKNTPRPQSKKDNDLTPFIQKLISFASLAHQIQTQAHLIHFNYEGEDFLSMHKLLQKEYEHYQKVFDTLGEFVRSYDFLMPMCHKGLDAAYKKLVHVESYDGVECLCSYLTNLKTIADMSKDIRKMATKHNAIDVENYCADVCAHSYKVQWMIKATLRDA